MSQHIDPTPKQTALQALSDSLIARANYYTVINMKALTTSYVESENLYSRKFSDYQFLVFTPLLEGWLRNSIVIPSNIFTGSVAGIALYFHSGNNVIEVDVKCVSDTKASAKYIGTLSSTCYLYCHGLLLKE